MKKIVFFLFTVFLLGSYGKISILSPESLQSDYQNASIEYSVGNFGIIPYGKSITGQVVLTNPETACTPFNLTHTSENKKAPILLVRRGNCSFVTKAHYAQLNEVQLLIIYDDVEEKSEKLIMKDDGFAYDIKIPSILIGKKDGENLRSYIQNSDPLKKNVSLRINFEMDTYKHVKITFFLSISNRNSFKLIRDFHPYISKVANVSSFTPRYAIWTCPYCGNKGFTEKQENCLSGGRYCGPVLKIKYIHEYSNLS
jgi:hypothetical protein